MLLLEWLLSCSLLHLTGSLLDRRRELKKKKEISVRVVVEKDIEFTRGTSGGEGKSTSLAAEQLLSLTLFDKRLLLSVNRFWETEEERARPLKEDKAKCKRDVEEGGRKKLKAGVGQWRLIAFISSSFF